jgi:DNA repair protein SbcC/Rad50
MIPKQLTVKNFLSYRETTLDFCGLHTACICGSNGAGKSSLLEAITWAVWGESRASTEDDVIHTGEKEVRVDFTFETNKQVYKVIRTRNRSGNSVLEFQVETSNGFRALTGKGVRATQDLILEHVKLDYDTFINSAYLRQGRADEFMLKRPAERKEILAELLKLNEYDDLEDKAKELSRNYKARTEELERSLEDIRSQLQKRDAINQQKTELEVELNTLQQQQEFDNVKLQSLQVVQHQRQNWEQQLNFVRQQYQNLTQDCDRLQQEQGLIKSQISHLDNLINREDEIITGYQLYQSLQKQDEALGEKFAEFSGIQQQRQQKQHQLSKHIQQIEGQLQRVQAQLEALLQQEKEVQQALNKTTEVEAAIIQLNAARQRVTQLDDLHVKVTPLLKQRMGLQNQIDRYHAGLVARLEQLQSTENQLKRASHRQPQLQQAVVEVGVKIEDLEKKRVYLQRVQEKGQERRHFMERLQAHQRDYERLLGEQEQKLHMLQTPNALCPLCERPLDEHHWNRVVDKTNTESQDAQDQLWVLREQMAVSEREIQVLRQEYREISQLLSGYDSLREQRGQLLAQLESSSDAEEQLLEIVQEKQKLEQILEMGDYAPEKQAELQELDRQIQSLNYSEKDHSLARSEAERLRWAEVRQAQIKEALKRQSQFATRKPQIEAEIARLEALVSSEQVESDITKEIVALEQHLNQIAYNTNEHNRIRQEVRKNQPWELRYQQLLSAKEQYPQLQHREKVITQALQARGVERQTLLEQINAIVKQLETIVNPTSQIHTLEQQLLYRRRQLDEKIAFLGRLDQQIQFLEHQQDRYQKEEESLKNVKQQQRVYQELAQAFGKNGIQALMIENVLPQLEAETNQLLSRLSANQLHVQFITQKAGKSSRSTKKNAKLIDTLDILIGDAKGTRAYETYSGGEAFRINFAIRLALAKLLAQRAGAALQMLIVDEGFGTQDAEGCDRLIAAINAIAPDFACILTVTHMPHLKEAFQARIEVHKTQQGSHVRLSI